MTKVLIAEDSPVSRQLLAYVVGSAPGLEVLGPVEDGARAVEYVQSHDVDIVLMDVHMPNMDGFEACRTIMETKPLPIVLMSATMAVHDVRVTFDALDAGALTFLGKPMGPDHPEFRKMTDELIRTLRLMAEVRVVKRRPRKDGPPQIKDLPEIAPPRGTARIIVVGSSTGGPGALADMISELSPQTTPAIVVVQHIANGFVEGFVQWLDGRSGLTVKVGEEGENILGGYVYIAPEDLHIGIGKGGVIQVSDGEPEGGFRPSIDHLFLSVAKTYGSSAVAVLLSGMGRDGAEGLLAIRDAGGTTVVQNRESSVVFGMANVATTLGAVQHALSPVEIGGLLTKITEPQMRGTV